MKQVEGKEAGFFKGRVVWMVLFVAAVMILVIVLIQYVYCREQLANAQRHGEAIQAKLDALQSGSLQPGRDIGELNKQGLSKREEALAVDLMRHRELIPYKGVMGGTMGFYSKEDIHVLTSRWVMALFEDGHVGGRMLLEYAVSPGGEIQWKVIAAYLD